MENNDTLIDQNTGVTPERPEMLKILCILSYIGIGLMLLFGILCTFSFALS